jgi:hypothetical protein
MSPISFTRRDFLRTTGAAALIASTGIPLLGEKEEKKQSKVILIRNKNVTGEDGSLQPNIIEQMFDDAVRNLFDARTTAEAWEKITQPTDVVGIKTNVWKYLRTPVELEQIIMRRMITAGVEEKNISVDDRGIGSNPTFQNATALINVRPMRAHNWSGVGGCLKNYIMFTSKPYVYHPDSCIDLGAIWNLPHVKGKTRLNILLMLTPQFNCLGPHHFDKEFTWRYNGFLVGTDPVAVDAVGLKIIEEKRRQFFKEDSPMRPSVTHIKAAEEKHGVGVADINKIKIVSLGWKEGILL